MKFKLSLVCAMCLFLFSTISFSQDDKKQITKKEPVKLKKVKAGKSDLKQIKKVSTSTNKKVK